MKFEGKESYVQLDLGREQLDRKIVINLQSDHVNENFDRMNPKNLER